MPSDLAERIWQLVKLIGGAGGFGSVTLMVEKGRVARIVWSVDERVEDQDRNQTNNRIRDLSAVNANPGVAANS